jgi:hypothetical protein
MTDWVKVLLGKKVIAMAKIMDETFKEGSYEQIIIYRGMSALMYRCVAYGIVMGTILTLILMGFGYILLA